MVVGLYGQIAAEPERRAAAAHRALEVRLQELKSIVRIRFAERQPRTAWNSAAPERIRLLCQRESAGRSSALEPGHGAAHRRRSIFDKRSRRCRSMATRARSPGSTRAWTCEATSDAPERRAPLPVHLQAARVRRLPRAAAVAGASGAFGLFGVSLGADPVETLLHTTGKTALQPAADHAAASRPCAARRLPHLMRLRRMLGLVRVLLRRCCTSPSTSCSTRHLDFASIVKDIAKRPYITVGFAALLIADSAGRHFDQQHDAAAGAALAEAASARLR